MGRKDLDPHGRLRAGQGEWVKQLQINSAVYKSGMGARGQGRVCEDLGLGDARKGTWGRQV